MTIPYERTRALVETKEFLQALKNPAVTPRIPKAVRETARKLLRHYPTLMDIEQAHKALPHLYGPVPPFQRMVPNPEILGIIEATKDGN